MALNIVWQLLGGYLTLLKCIHLMAAGIVYSHKSYNYSVSKYPTIWESKVANDTYILYEILRSALQIRNKHKRNETDIQTHLLWIFNCAEEMNGKLSLINGFKVAKRAKKTIHISKLSNWCRVLRSFSRNHFAIEWRTCEILVNSKQHQLSMTKVKWKERKKTAQIHIECIGYFTRSPQVCWQFYSIDFWNWFLSLGNGKFMRNAIAWKTHHTN